MDVFSYVSGRDEAEAAAQAQLRRIQQQDRNAAARDIAALELEAWQRVAERSALLALVKLFVRANPNILNDAAWSDFFAAYDKVRSSEAPNLHPDEARRFADKIYSVLL